jgi:L-iditol 2-dehydrogenase
MRALILYGPGDLRLEEIARPEPRAGEIVVAIDAALTCATDAKMLARGRHPALGPVPAPFGHEGAGTVAAIGRGVSAVAAGDAVAFANSAPCGACEWCLAGRPGLCPNIAYLTGTYAEYVRVPAPIVASNVVRRPAGLGAPLAALAEPVACGVRAVERSAAREGQSVVILGGGLQGQVIGAVLARRGCHVTVCDPHPERRDLALLMGATAVADAPRDADGIARVRALTPGGLGAHVTVAAVGTVAAWKTAVALTRPGGEANFHGGPAPDAVLSLPAARLHYQEITLQASYHHTPETFRRALAMIDAGRERFAALLGPEIGLEQVAAALAARGPKRVVRPGPAAGGTR